MGMDENERIFLHHLPIFNEGQVDLVDKIISPDYVYHLPDGGTLQGPEGFKKLVRMTREAFPDIHYEFDGIVGEGEWVIGLYTMMATHTGDFLGVPATGQKVEMKEAYCCRIDNKKEVEAITYNDMLTFSGQVSVTPPLP